MIPPDWEEPENFMQMLLEVVMAEEVNISEIVYWQPDLEYCSDCKTEHLWWYLTEEGNQALFGEENNA